MTTEARPAALILPNLFNALYVRDTWLSERAGPSPYGSTHESCATRWVYKNHQHIGHKREQIAAVVTALRDLTRFRVEFALGAKVYTRDPTTGRRTARRVIERTISEVLVVTGTDEVRFLADGERLPLGWEIAAGG